jgi:hypothetical protein
VDVDTGTGVAGTAVGTGVLAAGALPADVAVVVPALVVAPGLVAPGAKVVAPIDVVDPVGGIPAGHIVVGSGNAVLAAVAPIDVVDPMGGIPAGHIVVDSRLDLEAERDELIPGQMLCETSMLCVCDKLALWAAEIDAVESIVVLAVDVEVFAL